MDQGLTIQWWIEGNQYSGGSRVNNTVVYKGLTMQWWVNNVAVDQGLTM